MRMRSFLPFALALVSAGFIAGTAAAQDIPYVLNIESSTKTMTPGGSTTFHINVANQSENPIDFYVERISADFPDQSWYSSFCFNGNCFDPETIAPPPAHLGPGGTVLLEITVVGIESVANTTGKLTVRFSNVLGSNSMTKEFTVDVASGSGVLTEAPAALTAIASPNPAATHTQIAIPASLKDARSISAALYDARGLRVADLSSAAQNAVDNGSGQFTVDLAGLANGAYFYTLSSAGRSAKGSVVVVH